MATMRAFSSVDIPYESRDELLDSLYSLPNPPDIHWPDNLRVETRVGTPKPRLAIDRPEAARRVLVAKVLFDYGAYAFRPRELATTHFIAKEATILQRDREAEAAFLETLERPDIIRLSVDIRHHEWRSEFLRDGPTSAMHSRKCHKRRNHMA